MIPFQNSNPITFVMNKSSTKENLTHAESSNFDDTMLFFDEGL